MGRRAARATAAAAVALLVGAGGYLAADAYDVVPGVVTLAPPPPQPPPFPTAPAAVLPGPVLPVLDPPDAGAPVPDAGEVTARAQAAAAHRWMGPSVGVVVADQITGEVLADVGGAVPRVPASTAKLLTAVAALRVLGPDTTVSTRVVQEAPGQLVLVGGGDVMLAAGPGDPGATNGRAGLADLAAGTARALRLAGTTEVTVDVDDSLFSGPAVSPGWAPTDLTGGFVAAVTPIAVDIARTRDEPYPPRFADPSLHAAEVFAGQLEAQGITVTRAPSRAVAGPGAPELASVRSAPVEDVVEYLLHTSDNTVTEVVCRLVAVARGLPGSFDGGTQSVLAEAGALGIDTAGAALGDCSGLADGSALSARLLADLVRAAGIESELRPVAVDMPVAGWQGTLADRLDEPPASGLVRAKTGSLRGVTSLAGTVLTQDGRQLVFAVLADATPPGGQLGPRRVIDTFVQQLAGCGCELP